MPRFPRSYIKTSFFHIITQGINKSYIFEKAEEYPYSNYKRIDKNLQGNYIFIDIEDDEKICEKVIQDFLIENNVELNDLKKDKRRLKELIIILKTEYNISLRKIAEKIGMGRETIRRIYNE